MIFEQIAEEIHEENNLEYVDEKDFKEMDKQSLIENFIHQHRNDLEIALDYIYERKQTIIKEIGCNKFPGFYHSIFCDPDEFISEEQEMEEELGIRKGDTVLIQKAEVVYEYDDFNKYKKDVCTAFMEKYIEKINDILPYEITEANNFKFEIINKEDVQVVSPRYYNYNTDKCYCDIATNYETLNNIKEYTLKLPGAKQYILDNHSSYDGFISFIDNRITYWESLMIEEYEENMLIALLDMLVILSDKENIKKISFDTLDDVDSRICYASPVIYYNGETYTEKEFKNKFLGDK